MRARRRKRGPTAGQRFIRLPFSVYDEARERGLSDGAVRLYVTSWALADPTGFVSTETVERASERIGDQGLTAPVASLDALLAELAQLGFLKNLVKDEAAFTFEPSGAWLS